MIDLPESEKYYPTMALPKAVSQQVTQSVGKQVKGSFSYVVREKNENSIIIEVSNIVINGKRNARYT